MAIKDKYPSNLELGLIDFHVDDKRMEWSVTKSSDCGWQTEREKGGRITDCNKIASPERAATEGILARVPDFTL
ncbi:hypothetical protein HZH66_008283 [Vespula vulgaris]|uniref:Uncharacterized protein n=1 Tax=Vespula vulgaris TaxID=7454 RepID=A0A834JUX8_VESVU|nr:hypothetical protein HZH66_008283 [Vespula vulgaris]